MSEVFFSSARLRAPGLGSAMSMPKELSAESVVSKVPVLLEKAGIANTIKSGDYVAIKIHFGRIGGYRVIRPPFVRKVVETIKSLGGRPFVTDTWGLSHLDDALYNGFSDATVGAPIVPVSGIKENDFRVVQVDGIHLKEVKVAGNIYDADAIINFARTSFHHSAGLAALIKNLAMGCSAPDTRRQRLHNRMSEAQ
ncbi:MAG: uncharacterized protein QG670_2181, partial [Thermoproteota archaeon]|nr:uncharacterized protein [Thermoproteota archaeon]